MEIKLKKPKFGKPKFASKSLLNFFVNLGSKNISQVFVLFIVLIGLNVFSQKFFLRIDLTNTKTYTLSQGTKKIISLPDDTVSIKLFYSDNVPPDLIQVRQDTIDLYEEYVRFSNGKIDFEIKNPKDENFKTDASTAGVPEVQYQEYSQDKYEVAKGYLGASISYKEQNEAIELITPENVQNLEYETTSRIYKLTNEEKQVIGFLTGHGEKSVYADLSTVAELLGSEFDVQVVDIYSGEPINPQQIKVLVVAAPTSNLTERDKFEIDQYIMLGGRVVFLIDKYEINYQTNSLSLIESNFFDFVKNYGIEATDAVLLDESYLPLQYIFTYPYWVLTQGGNISKDNPALSQLESMVFFWANPLKGINEDLNITDLIKTTDRAWLQTGEQISIDPSQQFYPINQQQYNLALLVEGKQTSLYKDQEIPVLENDSEEETEDKRTDDYPRADEVNDAKIVVIGDSDFISDDLVAGSEQNSVFFVNLIEWLSNSNDLIEIRSKNVVSRPLENISESEKNVYKSVNLLIIPALLISGGIVYNTMRRKKKSVFEVE